VYAFATREVPAVLTEAMEEAGITVDNIDHLLLHQANIRIMETVAKRLKLPMSKVRATCPDLRHESRQLTATLTSLCARRSSLTSTSTATRAPAASPSPWTRPCGAAG
jgi:hypothetical protein